MQVLKFTDTRGKPLAAITFFAVHATSTNRTNRLISSDNKGVASLLFEKAINPNGTLPGKGDFVALFPNGNHGDISPNTQGGFCSGTTIKCDSSPGDCGDCSLCAAPGPGNNQEESTLIIGQKQYAAAKWLFDTATTKLQAPINYIYEAIDMSQYTLLINETTEKTCKPAVGISMFAGTTDGPGLPTLCQGIKSLLQPVLQSLFGPNNALWTTIEPAAETVSNILSACHAPKPVLIPTGEMNTFAIPVQPTILPTQILRIGNILIAALPGEFTTMSGRRMRDAITAAAGSQIGNIEVAISGVSNAYSSYVTTFEEYQAQRTSLYGPHTLSAYLDQYGKLARKLVNNTSSNTTLQEPNYYTQAQLESLNFVRTNIIDLTTTMIGKVIIDASSTYKIGQTVSVKFQGANPNNDLRTGQTYLTVEKCSTLCLTNTTIVATDASWETKFLAIRPEPSIGTIEVTILWTIPDDTVPGTYQIRYFGKSITNFVATSSSFRVTT